MANKQIHKRLFLGLIFILLGSAPCVFWFFHYVRPSCVKIPVKFSHSNLPIIEALIEGEAYPLMLDLGANFSLSLDEDLLEKINKQISDPVKTWDWKGNVYKYPSYLISKVNLCGLGWKNVAVKGTNRQFHESAAIWSDDPQKVKIKEFKGTIGVPLLEKTNLCLDLDREAIFICNSLKTLQKKDICPQDMVQIPFSLIKGHIFVLAETDVGQLNLMIDTGCTISTIKSSLNKEFSQKTDRRGLPFITSSCLKFSENNFGEIDFYLLDLDPGFTEIDGVLGMNFLEKYIIYIDYLNKFLYIENPNPAVE